MTYQNETEMKQSKQKAQERKNHAKAKKGKKVGQPNTIEDALNMLNTEERPGYQEFIAVLGKAYHQSAFGKGKERHGEGRDFTQQPILTEALELSSAASSYQVSKKSKEAYRLAARGEFDKAKEDILGSIVYAVTQFLVVEEEERRYNDKHDIEAEY